MLKKDIYDIIIESIIKDWNDSVKQIKREQWKIPQYSKSEINKAGSIIVDSFDTVREAYPNYFVDISGFINMLKEIVKINKNNCTLEKCKQF